MDRKNRARYLLLLAAVLVATLMVGCSKQQSGSGGGGSGGGSNGGGSGGNVAEAQTVQASSSKAPASSRIPADEPVARVAAAVGPSVVQVNVQFTQQTQFGTQRGEGIGSGVIYRKDGYIITNNHVVAGANKITVAFADGKQVPAKVVGRDPNSEIAVIKVDRNNLPAASFKTSGNPTVGQMAVAIGSPSGFESTVTSGVVSGTGREFPQQLVGSNNQEARALTNLIQTDAAISPGNSGGALVDQSGQVIGINVAYLPQTQSGAPTQGLGFAIPASTAVSIANQLIQTGRVETPYLGVYTSELTPEVAQKYHLPVSSGELVQRPPIPGSGAADAGVRKGDIITALGGKKIKNYGDLVGALRSHKPGDTVQLTVNRDGNQKTLNVTLGKSPQQ